MPGRTTSIPAVLWKALLVQSHGKGMAGSKSGRFAPSPALFAEDFFILEITGFPAARQREPDDCWSHADHGPPAGQFRLNALPEAAAVKGG